jgi:hypothetical protein
MQVTGIEISHYHHAPGTSRHEAAVYMTLRDRVVTLFCRIDLPGQESSAAPARALVDEAARQLGRMPEFRSGRETLELAADAISGLTLQQA